MQYTENGVLKAPAHKNHFKKTIALSRLQSAIEMERPCIIVSPPGFGQQNLIYEASQKLGRHCCKVRFDDAALTDPGALREAISNAAQLSQTSPNSKTPQVILIIEHVFTPNSINILKNLEYSYADAICLNRINTVLPILCTPFSSGIFQLPKFKSKFETMPDWLVIQAHELYFAPPVDVQQLLQTSPPYLHHSLLKITRLAESWPEMGTLLEAKLKGFLPESSLHSIDEQFNLNLDLYITNQALQSMCAELISDYQALMHSYASQMLSEEEIQVIALLSLYPANFFHYLPFIKAEYPEIHAQIETLCFKNILTRRLEEAPQGAQTLLSFANSAWKFYAQDCLTKCNSIQSIEEHFVKISELMTALLTQKSLSDIKKEFYQSLIIEFCLSTEHYEEALQSIVEQAHTQETINQNKVARIDQAISWFKLIPQRIINLNPQAKVIQSYHRLLQDAAQAEKQSIHNTFKMKESDHEFDNNLLLKRIKFTFANNQQVSQPLTQHKHKPRINRHETMDHLPILEAETLPVSLHQVEVSNHNKTTQASLLLDVHQHIENSNFDHILTIAQAMIEQALNQQKPELFLHGLAHIWYQTQICTSIHDFKAHIERILTDERLSTQLNEFRYWLNQICTAIEDTANAQREFIAEITVPNAQHLSSLGQNLLGYMTCYFNSIIALSHCNSAQVTDRLQESTYYAMNLPDTMSQTLMPIWLIEVFNLFQQNRLQQALTFIQNTSKNNTSGSQRIFNPLFRAFESFANIVQSRVIDLTPLEVKDKSMDQLLILTNQLEAQALLWQHQYKKSDKLLQKYFKLINNTGKTFEQHTPWIWFGPSSWYLLENFRQNTESNRMINEGLDELLNRMKICFNAQHELDAAFLTLSKRESEILGLVVEGYSNEEISNLLCRSIGTIKLHIHSIYKKLNVSNRVNAIKKCHSSGFFSFGFQ